MTKNPVNRRKFIKILGGGALAAGGLFTIRKAVTSPSDLKLPDPYPELPNLHPVIPDYNDKAQAFDQHQYALVATLAAIIIPSDGEPGATETGVVDYIDELIANSEAKQKTYKRGLKWIDDISRKELGNDFLSLSLQTQIGLLRKIEECTVLRWRPVSGFMDRLLRKIYNVWDDLFGIGRNSAFFRTIRKDVIFGFFTNPISWQHIGYFGPPQPVGYLGFSQPPDPDKYTGTIRQVQNETCIMCHSEGKEHPRGLLIDHSCITCHRPHLPWPRNENGFCLEDHVEVIFPSPNRKTEDIRR